MIEKFRHFLSRCTLSDLSLVSEYLLSITGKQSHAQLFAVVIMYLQVIYYHILPWYCNFPLNIANSVNFITLKNNFFRPLLPNRIFWWKYFISTLLNTTASSHMWPLSTKNLAGATKFAIFNLINLNSYMRLLATVSPDLLTCWFPDCCTTPALVCAHSSWKLLPYDPLSWITCPQLCCFSPPYWWSISSCCFL